MWRNSILHFIKAIQYDGTLILGMQITSNKYWFYLYVSMYHINVIILRLQTPNSSKTHIIGKIYRRPIDIVSSCNKFSAAFAETSTLLQKKKRYIYIYI